VLEIGSTNEEGVAEPVSTEATLSLSPWLTLKIHSLVVRSSSLKFSVSALLGARACAPNGLPLGEEGERICMSETAVGIPRASAGTNSPHDRP